MRRRTIQLTPFPEESYIMKFTHKKTAKSLPGILLLLFLTFFFAGTAHAASPISFNPPLTQVMMKAGSSKRLNVVFNKKAMFPGKLTWKSSNTKVAGVENGKILAKKSGTAKITAVLKTDKSKKVSCIVYVYSQDKKISFDRIVNRMIEKGTSFTLKPSQTCKAVIWKSSDPSTASVSQKGRVKALKPGTVMISYYGASGGKWRYVARIKLQIGIMVRTIRTGEPGNTLTLYEGESRPASFSVEPAGATRPGLVYQSSNSSIVEVDASGRIQAVNPGSAFITASATDGSEKQAVLLVKVRNSVSTEKILLTAHRGASLAAPENTIPAFELAGAAGAAALECDVYVTKDGCFVIHHDKSILRMCGIEPADGEDISKYNIQNMTLQEIQSYPIRSGSNVENYPDLRIPTLYEYLQVCNRYHAVPVVELKGTYTTQDLNQLKRELSISHQVPIIISFNGKWLIPFSNQSGYRVQYIRSVWSSSMLSLCKKYNWGLDLNYANFTDSQIQEFVNQGIEVQLWLVDDTETMQKYLAMGVREFTTNQLIA